MKNKDGKQMTNLTIFNLKGALNKGLTHRIIAKKTSDGEFLKLSHGLYLNLKANIPFEQIDFIAANYKFGKKSIIGGLTALFYHGLLEHPPQQIWVIVPQDLRTTEKKYRLIRKKKIIEFAIEKHKYFRICDINRAIVEGFQYSKKIGIRTAIFATVKAIREKKTTLSKIMETAKKLECENSIKSYWEIIVGALEAQ